MPGILYIKNGMQQKLPRLLRKWDLNLKGVWIDVSHITDLKDEIMLWLNEGALVIVDYKKNGMEICCS